MSALVVIDTNVMVAALQSSRGASYRIQAISPGELLRKLELLP